MTMTQEVTELSVISDQGNQTSAVVQSSASPETSEVSSAETAVPLQNPCACNRAEIEFTCHRCQKELCAQCTYREDKGTLTYCRDCANALVGVCDVCDAVHAKPCHECGLMVCELHHKKVIEKWGWGGRAGQGGVLEWFPVMRTYCQEHGQKRSDRSKPEQRFTGMDGSSPEW
jgi:hypothetical protein